MVKLYYLLIFVIGTFLLTVFPSPVSAECVVPVSNINWSPIAATPNDTVRFTGRADDCQGHTFAIWAYDTANDRTISKVNATLNADGTWTANVIFPSAGRWNLHMCNPANESDCEGIGYSIEITGNEQTLACGAVCAANSTRCNSQCPCRPIGAPNGEWRCGGTDPTPSPAPTTAPAAPILTPPCSGGTCETAIGDINASDPVAFIKQLYAFIFVIAGAAAVLVLIYAGYLFMVSGGDKQKISDAREVITAALAGLLFIIFAIALLEFIGITVLRIPGLRP